ncbi:MAG: hypothetical protein Q9217_005177, partial [Psora testacea]
MSTTPQSEPRLHVETVEDHLEVTIVVPHKSLDESIGTTSLYAVVRGNQDNSIKAVINLSAPCYNTFSQWHGCKEIKVPSDRSSPKLTAYLYSLRAGRGLVQVATVREKERKPSKQ